MDEGKRRHVPVGISLDKATLQAVDRMAQAEQRNRSQMIRVLIGRAVATEGAGQQGHQGQEG